MIQHLQSGGGLYFNPLGSYVKAKQAAAAEASTKTTKKDDGLISDKLMLELLKNGIPVDVDNFMSKLADLEEDIDNGFGVSKRALYSLQAQANRVIQQATYLKTAETNAEKNDALGEIAVGGRGELYTLDGTKIKSISSSEYDASKHGAAMTVGELIEHRKFNPTQVGDIELTKVINDNLGMSKITEYLQKIIASVGQASNTEEAYIDLAGYIGREAAKKPTAQQLESLQRVYSIIQQYGPNALFKIKNTAEGKNLEAAYEYILQVLPRSMKMQLLGRNVASGNKFETGGEYIHNLIVSALNSGNETKMQEYISYEDSLNKASGSRTGKASETNMSGLEQLTLGTLGKVQYNIISKKNSGLQFTLNGSGLGLLTDTKNGIVNASILTDALNTGLGALIDKNQIYFGDQKISPYMLDKFIYNGEEVINVWAPIKSDGQIDFGKLEQFEELKQRIKNNPRLTREDIALLMQEIGINGTLDENGNFIGQDPNMVLFIVMTGLTSDEVVDDEENEFSYQLLSDDKKEALAKIRLIYGIANKGLKGDQKREFPTGWFDWSTKIIAAPIFMRLGTTARFDAGTIVGNGARILTQSYESLIANDQANPINKPSSSIL